MDPFENHWSREHQSRNANKTAQHTALFNMSRAQLQGIKSTLHQETGMAVSEAG